MRTRKYIMVKEATTNRATHGKHTIVLPITEEHYAQIIDDPQRVRSEWLEPFYAESPELFPPGIERRLAACLRSFQSGSRSCGAGIRSEDRQHGRLERHHWGLVGTVYEHHVDSSPQSPLPQSRRKFAAGERNDWRYQFRQASLLYSKFIPVNLRSAVNASWFSTGT